MRRIARLLPSLVPALQEDTQALAAAVRELAPAVPPPAASAELAAALAVADGLPAAPVPSLDELAATNLVLRGELARLAGADDLTPEIDQAPQRHLRALAAREAALRLSPWER